jgi:hypothetical protein
MRPVIIPQNADQVICERRDFLRFDGFVGSRLLARFRDVEMRVIDGIAGPVLRFWNVEGKCRLVAARRSLGPVGHI